MVTIRFKLSAMALILIFSPLLLEARPSASAPKVHDEFTQRVADRILELVNQERRSNRLRPVEHNVQLQQAALYHSFNMVHYSFYNHVDHIGKGPQDRVNTLFPGLLGGVSENIAWHSGEDSVAVADRLMDLWMRSPGHRRNILDPESSYLGVGIQADPRTKRIYGTQKFGKLNAMMSERPDRSSRFGDKVTLTFLFLGKYPRDELSIFVSFPDQSARHYLPDGRFYTGLGIFEPEWIDDHSFTLSFTADKGRGNYLIRMGRNQRYVVEKGITIRVE